MSLLNKGDRIVFTPALLNSMLDRMATALVENVIVVELVDVHEHSLGKVLEVKDAGKGKAAWAR